MKTGFRVTFAWDSPEVRKVVDRMTEIEDTMEVMTDPKLKAAIEWTRAHPQTRGCDLVKNAGSFGRMIFAGEECPVCLFLERYDKHRISDSIAYPELLVAKGKLEVIETILADDEWWESILYNARECLRQALADYDAKREKE